MNRETRQAPVADIKLERYALRELPEAEMAQMSRLLEQDAPLRARLDALEQSDREIRERYPASQMAGLVRARLWGTTRREPAPSKAGVQRLWPVLATLAAAALLVLTVLPEGFFTGPGAGAPLATEEVVRIRAPGDGGGREDQGFAPAGAAVPEDPGWQRAARGRRPRSGG